MAQHGSSVTQQRTLTAPTQTLVVTQTVQEQVTAPAQARQEAVTLVLRPRKQVSWRDGTVDNEHMQKKSSKICCVFHKKESLEDYSDDEDNQVKEKGSCHGHSHRDDGSGPSGSHDKNPEENGESHENVPSANGKRSVEEWRTISWMILWNSGFTVSLPTEILEWWRCCHVTDDDCAEDQLFHDSLFFCTSVGVNICISKGTDDSGEKRCWVNFHGKLGWLCEVYSLAFPWT